MEDDLVTLCEGEVLTPKFVAFLEGLAMLCRDHEVTLSTSHYDRLQVWDADAMIGPIHCTGIENLTRQARAHHRR